MKTIPEILAPAGNLERLNTAFHFGADAVYVGAKRMSLRNFADNFSMDELMEGCSIAHKSNKKVYVACNAFAKEEQFNGLSQFLQDIQQAGADALIVNDPGVIMAAKEAVPNMELHLSTQANTLNSHSARFWHQMGIKRIVLARELSLQEISTIRAAIPEDLELEMFVHGAMCISYSGRCLFSNYINGRDSNCGECVQPCRWSYEIRERGTDGAFFPVEQDEFGTYIFNSRDLNLISYLPEIISSGVCSLKIEGRMKSIYYVAGVVNAYRMALDAYVHAQENNLPYQLPDCIESEMEKVSHRAYTTGFAFGNPKEKGQSTMTGGYMQSCELSARVICYDETKKSALIEQRNRFYDGETLEILSPGDVTRSFEVQGMYTEEGESVTSAPHPKQRLWIGCTEPLKENDLLRKPATNPTRTNKFNNTPA